MQTSIKLKVRKHLQKVTSKVFHFKEMLMSEYPEISLTEDLQNIVRKSWHLDRVIVQVKAELNPLVESDLWLPANQRRSLKSVIPSF